MDIAKLVKLILDQGDALMGASIPFTVLLVLGWVTVWRLQKWHYDETIKAKNATIEMQNQRIGLMMDLLGSEDSSKEGRYLRRLVGV